MSILFLLAGFFCSYTSVVFPLLLHFRALRHSACGEQATAPAADHSSDALRFAGISHNVFRLLVPYALIIAFLAAGFGDTFFLAIMFAAQCFFYALGVLGFLGINSRLMSAINVFLQLSAAAVVGAWRALTGGSSVRWKQA